MSEYLLLFPKLTLKIKKM